jgi:hypothetical protein
MHYLALPLIGVHALAIVFAFRRGQEMQALPGISWLFLAVLPFWIVSGRFAEDTANIQLIGISVVSIAICLSDAFASAYARVPAKTERLSIDGLLLPVLVVFVLLIPIVHLLSAGHVPLIERLNPDLSPEESAMIRENFSKLLALPEFIKVVFNWNIVLFAPVLTAYLVKTERWRGAVFVAVWTVLYALASSARLPFILYLANTFLIIVLLAPPRVGRTVVICTIGGLSVLTAATQERVAALDQWYELASASGTEMPGFGQFQAHASRTGLPVTPGDMERLDDRLLDEQRPSTFTRYGDYAVYRAFLGPIEVANRWYAFFPDASGGWRPMRDLVPLPGLRSAQHAANRLAIWAYVERFPRNYFQTSRAYAGLDADAYSYGGLILVALAGFVLLIIRILGVLLLSSGRLSAILYGLLLSFYTVFPFQASIQAMLFSHGMLVVFVGMLILKIGSQMGPVARGSARSVVADDK